jgi:hypothetical protein
MKTFDINTETSLLAEFVFAGKQLDNFNVYNCERVFRWRYVAGNVNNLPKYILSAIDEYGYEAIHLGGTTYQYSVIGLRKKQA